MRKVPSKLQGIIYTYIIIYNIIIYFWGKILQNQL